MFSLCQKHAWVLVIATMHLVFEHLIEVFIYVVVLEWRPCLLVTLISLLPLFPFSNLRNLIPPEVLISALWVILISVLGVILFSGNRSFSHGHSLHQFLYCLHHQVKLVIRGPRCRWLCISLGFLITSVEFVFDIPRRHHIYLNFNHVTHHFI